MESDSSYTSSGSTTTTVKRTTTTGYGGDTQTTVEEYHTDEDMRPIDQRFGQIQEGKQVWRRI